MKNCKVKRCVMTIFIRGLGVGVVRVGVLWLVLASWFALVADAKGPKKKDVDLYRSLIELDSKTLLDGGHEYYERGANDTALIYYSIVCGKYDRALPIEERRLVAESYNAGGTIHYYYCNYRKALEMYIKGLEICDEIGYGKCEAKILNNIGNVYFAFQDYENANVYYQRSYEGFKRMGDDDYAVMALSNLTSVSCCLKLNERAMGYIREARRLNVGGNVENAYAVFTSLGSIHTDMGGYDSALFYFHKTLRLLEGNGRHDNERWCSSLYNIADAHKSLRNYDSAIYYLESSNDVASRYGMDKIVANNYSSLSEVYELRGDYRRSLSYKSKYLRMYDSIFNVTEYGKIKEMPFLYEIDKIDRQMVQMGVEREINDSRMRMQRMILCVVLAGLFVILTLLIVVYGQKSKVSQMYRDLFNRNMDIVNSEEYNKNLRLKYEGIIDLKNEELDRLRATAKGVKVEGFNVKGGGRMEENSVPPTVSCLSTSESSFQPSEGRVKYQSSSLTDEQKQQLKNTIEGIMERKELFSDVDFSLDKLAEMIGSNTRYTSQIINEFYGKNFNSFINEHRIKEARKLLADPGFRNYTIEAISLKVGFRSKASFNITFKKLTGLIPSDYQKMAINSR